MRTNEIKKCEDEVIKLNEKIQNMKHIYIYIYIYIYIHTHIYK